MEELEKNNIPNTPTPDTAPMADDEESIASAEDIAAYEREAAEKRKRSKVRKVEDEEGELSREYEEMTANAIDPYLEPDPTLPKVPYNESLFLNRGCSHCPTAYVPVKEHELRSCCKVGSSNWMKDIRRPCEAPFDMVEVRFKNNRKDFYRIPDGIDVSEGDIVAVEGMPGHDIGIVSLMGEACRIQMKKKKVDPNAETTKKLFRRAKTGDIEKWIESLKDEHNTLLKTRRISEELGLVMKVNDVEYQGDHSKAIFYYTAEDRVDFRTLIKVLAEEFKVRIEMKQIGVRQEAGKVGGIGTCGRELCCSTWLTNFKSVTTGVAKAQQILPNPQKLAGQCGKLKCCLNFEYDVYVDALKQFPPANTPIRFKKGLAMYKKTDVFRGIMWYAYEGNNELYAIPADSVKKIIEMNHNQEYPEKLEDFQVELMSSSAIVQEADSSEFEQELRRMADNGSEATGDDKDKRRRNDNHRRNDRPRNNEQRLERLEQIGNMDQFANHSEMEVKDHHKEGNRNNKKRRNNHHNEDRQKTPNGNGENHSEKKQNSPASEQRTKVSSEAKPGEVQHESNEHKEHRHNNHGDRHNGDQGRNERRRQN